MERSNQPWDQSEDDFILWRISSGKTFESIAESTSRTPQEIEKRLRTLAIQFVDEGKTLEEASEYTGIPADKIFLYEPKTPPGEPADYAPVSYSRHQLRTIAHQNRGIRLTQIVNEITQFILQEAGQGKTHYTHLNTELPPEELRGQLQAKFPDCTITCTDTIRVDWS